MEYKPGGHSGEEPRDLGLPLFDPGRGLLLKPAPVFSLLSGHEGLLLFGEDQLLGLLDQSALDGRFRLLGESFPLGFKCPLFFTSLLKKSTIGVLIHVEIHLPDANADGFLGIVCNGQDSVPLRLLLCFLAEGGYFLADLHLRGGVWVFLEVGNVHGAPLFVGEVFGLAFHHCILHLVNHFTPDEPDFIEPAVLRKFCREGIGNGNASGPCLLFMAGWCPLR